MGPKKLSGPYDLWSDECVGGKNKLHPSQKRNLKAPLPHPGQSYNPDPEDHKRLLRKIAEAELRHQKKQAAINRATRVKVNARELVKHEQEELQAGIKHLIGAPKRDEKHSVSRHQDDTAGDSSSTDSAYSDYDEKDFETILADKTVEERRKTKRQRLAQLRDKLQRKAAKMRKAKNIRLSKFDAIKRILKDLDKKEEVAAAAAKHRRKNRKAKKERLGTRFEQSDPIYCLGSELPSSLRETKCSMDAIVREQLENFQSRLMVEPTNFQIKKRKYKKKAFERDEQADEDAANNLGPIDYTN